MSQVFGVLSPFVGGDYYGAIIAGINAAAVGGGDRVMAVQTLDPGSHSADRSGLPEFHRPVSWRHLAGLIILPGAVSPAYAHAARKAGLAVVLVGQDPADSGSSAVVVDNRAGVKAAVEHLVGHGHERIAFAGNMSHFDVRERYEGYLEGLRASGVLPDPALLFDNEDNHETGGEAVADTLIRSDMPATAVVLGTDRNAVGLMHRMAQAGYDVPRDLAVVGFDDIPEAPYMRPSLSTVRQPLDQVGAAAWALAADLVAAGEPSPEVRQVPTTFVQRDSCGCAESGLPTSEPHTRALFGQLQTLQDTLNIQHELSLELLGTHDRDPRTLSWLGRTPAIGGCLGLWRASTARPEPADDRLLDIAGSFHFTPGNEAAGIGAAGDEDYLPVSEFPPAGLFDLTDGPAGDIVFVVPIRSTSRDWGMLAAVGRIQTATPPGREMMNQSGALLAAALDHDAMAIALREKEEGLRAAALHDHLTGLPNRALLSDRLRQAGLRASRRPGYRFAVLLLDLDGFKAVNDSMGHAAGDQLLIQVSKRLVALLRSSDTAARLGGDEFVIVLDGITDPRGEQVVCDAIMATLKSPFIIDGRPVEISSSIGVAVSTEASADPDHLLREADAAMYRAKSAARA